MSPAIETPAVAEKPDVNVNDLGGKHRAPRGDRCHYPAAEEHAIDLARSAAEVRAWGPPSPF